MDDWEPDETSSMDGRRMFFWRVPATVQGGWKVSVAGGDTLDVNFDQKFQKIEGTVTLGTIQGGLRDARLSGAGISFAIVDASGVSRTFTGSVNGASMEGTLRADNGAEGRWSATKR
jgi:hypothetical protein